MTTTPLLLITKDPSHPLAHLALRYTRALLAQSEARTADQDSAAEDNVTNDAPVRLFFYADAAHIANRLRWQSAD